MKRNISYWIVRLDYISGNIESNHVFSKRFAGDKAFRDDGSCLIVSDGIVLNSREMFKQYHADNITDIYKLILENKVEPKELIGPFSAFLYDKHTGHGVAFGNQTGDASVFYAVDESKHEVLLSNNFNRLCELIPEHQLDEESAYELCTHGFLLSDNTIVKGIHRLRAGKKLVFEKGKKPTVEIYHHFDFLTKREVSLDEAIDDVDRLFRKAVARCFDKDLEYGYKKHLASISGGLDSRMVNWVACDMGYTNIINDSYSQSGSDEMKFAMDLEAKLGNQIYYRPLDDHTFIYDVEDICRARYGMAYYIADACKTQIDEILDYDTLGLLHTGQIGDALIGAKAEKNIKGRWNINTGRDSHLLPPPVVSEQYSCDEDFFYYGRVFQFTLCTSYSASDYTYIVSPFMDRELMEYCFSLPNELRFGHRLYWAWIDKKYPEAGKIPSTRKRFYKMTTREDMLRIHWEGLKERSRHLFSPILYMFGLKRSSVSSNHMNPYDYWYQTNPKTHAFIDNYYADNVHLVDAYPKIRKSVEKLMGGTAFEKLLAVSLLATVKIYIDGK